MVVLYLIIRCGWWYYSTMYSLTSVRIMESPTDPTGEQPWKHPLSRTITDGIGSCRESDHNTTGTDFFSKYITGIHYFWICWTYISSISFDTSLLFLCPQKPWNCHIWNHCETRGRGTAFQFHGARSAKTFAEFDEGLWNPSHRMVCPDI